MSLAATDNSVDKPFLIWITGLAGSGKSTLARSVFEDIRKHNPNTVLLDGDEFREVIDKREAYSRKDRLQIAHQITRFCKFLVDQRINVICATISLFDEVHQVNRANIERYFEVFVECDLEELIRRDQEELYSRALKGEINNVVGIDIEIEKPANCHLIVNNTKEDDLQNNIDNILKLLTK